MTSTSDPRLGAPTWGSPADAERARRRLRLLVPLSGALAVWYFAWLLRPSRVGDPLLFALLVLAELFNFVQAVGFWWTCSHGRSRRATPAWRGPLPEVDVLLPVYNEPLDVVAPTVRAAVAMRGARTNVFLLDDAGRPDLAALAASVGAGYFRREAHRGAKAGNLNYALGRTSAPFVAVFDCDHVPDARFVEETAGWMENPEVGFVQTPQYYANAERGGVAAAAWSQQALFFGPIARGKDGLGSMICCGTNVLFRRQALAEVGGFPEGSLTEDFELSLLLQERGWRPVYVDKVLAQGLGPEDMASYVSQQRRWARGCLAAIPLTMRAELPWRVRLQYLLSSLYFLTGWTVVLYMALPVVRIFTGLQPLAGASADQFLVHFAPYFCACLVSVAVAGAGEYTFDAFALMTANFSVQLLAGALVLTRRRGRFVVTAKRGVEGAQPRAVWPALVAIAGLVSAVGYALALHVNAATLNNVAFALLHICVLLIGCRAALVGHRRPRPLHAPRPARSLEEVAA